MPDHGRDRVRRTWRRLSVIVPAVCAIILLPIATNIATGAVPEILTSNAWLSWIGVVVLGLVSVAAYVREPTADQTPAVGPGRTPEPAPVPAPAAPGDGSAQPEEPSEETRDSRPVLLDNLPREVRGRDPVLKELRRLRREGGLVVLVGTGGAGKSTVARELIRRSMPRDPTAARPPTWEVTGATLRGLVDGLRVIAEELDASAAELDAIKTPGPTGPDCVFRLLNNAPPGWVLIIDNADDLDVLAKPAAPDDQHPPRLADGTGWVRAGQTGLVVVTSRQREERYWPASAHVREIGLLPEPAAAQILLDLAPAAGGKASARALARRLGRLPLALRLAGLYVGTGYGHATFDEFRAALEADPAVIKALELRDSDPEAVERMMVMRTWELSLDALAGRGLPQARPLLRMLSCFGSPDPVPVRMVRAGPLDRFLATFTDPPREPPRADQVLEGLDQLGLIVLVVRTADRGVVVHPVVADTNRVHLRDDPRESLIRSTAVGLVAAVVDDLNPQRPSTWPTMRDLAPHVQRLLTDSAPTLSRDDLENLVRMTERLASAYQAMGTPEFGITLLRAALAHAERPRMSTSVAFLVARQQLANLLAHAGRLDEAAEIFRAVLAAHLRRWPPDDPVNLMGRHNLAVLYMGSVSWDQSNATFHTLLADERRVLGDDHWITLSTRLEYASLLCMHRRLTDAETALRGVVADATRVQGPEAAFTLIARHNLARVLQLMKRRAEAVAATDALIEDERRVLGEDHFLTAATIRRNDSDLLTTFTSSTPALHQELAPVLYLRGLTMAEAGNHDDAIAVFDELITQFGEDPSADIRAIVAQGMFRKAIILSKRNRTPEASEAFRRLADRYGTETHRVMRELVALAFFNRAVILQRLDPAQALACATEAVSRYEDLHREDAEAFRDALARARNLLDEIQAAPATAIFDEAVRLRREGRRSDALAAIDRLVNLPRDELSTAAREVVARALLLKAEILNDQNPPPDGDNP
jgi:tetratricopeptide (TPR) repeat protein